jgi:CRISPR-associated endonuclease/helicase Cas3
LCAIAALHDLGKFAPRFQALATPTGWHTPSSIDGIDVSRFEAPKHTVDGLILWRGRVGERVGAHLLTDVTPFRELEYAVFTHHGRPQLAPRGQVQLLSRFPEAAVECANFCAERAVQVIGHSQVSPPNEARKLWRTASWWVAGLLVLSDWIGSRQQWFPYTAPEEYPSLELYWDYAQRQADLAVVAAGLTQAVPREAMSFSSLTGKAIPTPVQQWADSFRAVEPRQLVIVEDVTGAGKTEAATMLVHRRLASGACAGAFWGMPTQATANAMYLRQASLLTRLFAIERCSPSLVLSHGSAHLHDAFRLSVVGARTELSPVLAEGTDGEQSSEAACPAFLADDRRAGLLADVGSGTVDQVLLGALPTKFNALRLFALSEKTLVLDEVHAYDWYMNAEVEALLHFHATLGGSAVLLSATLPVERRRRIERVWAQAIGTDLIERDEVIETAYPLVSIVGKDGAVDRTAPGTAPSSARSVGVRAVYSEADCLHAVLQAYRQGASVCWIRNTVKGCLAAAALVRDAGVIPTVFHSRFAQGDRQAIEKELVETLGPTMMERPSRVVVATQVVEQSLDLDFDLIVTDLAPIDLLLQRSGRLWRHHHRAGRPLGSAELVVLGPDPDAPLRANWLEPEAPGTRKVYSVVSVLWHTWRRLLSRPVLEVPSEVRAMIESVYATEKEVPPVLLSADSEGHGEAIGLQMTAQQLVIGRGKGYAPESGFEDDRRASTRAGERQVTIRLAVLTGGVLRPWIDKAGMHDLQLWALSEVKLPGYRFRGALRGEPTYAAAVAQLISGWPEFERETPVLVLSPEGDRFSGRLSREGDGVLVSFEYSREFGLAFDPA